MASRVAGFFYFFVTFFWVRKYCQFLKGKKPTLFKKKKKKKMKQNETKKFLVATYFTHPGATPETDFVVWPRVTA